MNRQYLEVRRSDGGEERVELTGDLLTLGRAKGNDVALPSDSAVSRKHAVLQRAADGWVVRDAGSSNGTYVNGAMLEGERLLVPGDEVVLGESRVVLRGDGAAPESDTRQVAAARASAPLDLREEWDMSPAADVAPPPTGDPVERAETPAAPVARLEPEPRDERPLATGREVGRGPVRGVARDVKVRERKERQDMLQFRLERYDLQGNRLPPIAVVFDWYEGGQVGEGDEVEVSGSFRRGSLKARRVTNLSTGAEVHGPGGWQKVVLIVFLALVVGFIIFVIISIITAPSVEPPSFE